MTKRLQIIFRKEICDFDLENKINPDHLFDMNIADKDLEIFNCGLFRGFPNINEIWLELSPEIFIHIYLNGTFLKTIRFNDVSNLGTLLYDNDSLIFKNIIGIEFPFTHIFSLWEKSYIYFQEQFFNEQNLLIKEELIVNNDFCKFIEQIQIKKRDHTVLSLFDYIRQQDFTNTLREDLKKIEIPKEPLKKHNSYATRPSTVDIPKPNNIKQEI